MPATETKPKSSKAKSSKPKGKTLPLLTVKGADKYDLYQRSVQEPTVEVEFFRKRYKKLFGQEPTVLREDFCGTAAICAEWVRKKPNNLAIGVDLDPEPVEWGKTHNLGKLKTASREQVTFQLDDVRNVQGPKADIVAGENFSYFIFRDRAGLLEYFKAAYANLKEQGIFVLDIMGGPEVITPDQTDDRVVEIEKNSIVGLEPDKGVEHESPNYGAGGKFKYLWEQAWFDPISHDAYFHIHFKLKDGKIKRAFTYEWRLWTIPEVRELLEEAGFSRSEVYWEGADEDGEGNGMYSKLESLQGDEAAWVSYIVAVK